MIDPDLPELHTPAYGVQILREISAAAERAAKKLERHKTMLDAARDRKTVRAIERAWNVMTDHAGNFKRWTGAMADASRARDCSSPPGP